MAHLVKQSDVIVNLDSVKRLDTDRGGRAAIHWVDGSRSSEANWIDDLYQKLYDGLQAVEDLEALQAEALKDLEKLINIDEGELND